MAKAAAARRQAAAVKTDSSRGITIIFELAFEWR